jgi:hypothetical protein
MNSVLRIAKQVAKRSVDTRRVPDTFSTILLAVFRPLACGPKNSPFSLPPDSVTL